MKASGEGRVVARRYAKALLQVALEKKVDARQLGQQLAVLAAQVESLPGLAQALSSPTVARSTKTKLIETLLAATGADRLLANLLSTMARRDRLGALRLVGEAYAQAVDAHEGIEPAEVASAERLSERQQQKLAERLAALTGKRMRLSYRNDPAILGGLVVRIGNRIYDGSIVTQLDKLKERLLGAAR